ncbi:SCO family protein [Thaumasiovibrio subtropicus]|uniref:SCO family protein n=1 Tax=Thaumasiovibrio subtropicus TaxID=1891207 RepID=UPI000B3577C4|nr:SCO family protein [Thaumasiovibrio subtropicus]
MSNNPVRWVIMAGVLAIAGIIALYIDNTTIPIGERPKQFEELGGRFQLNSATGAIDSEAHKGKVVVMYFGFLNCAEVCPSSMGVMSASFKLLEKETYEHVQGFFVSVDPNRDDLDSLHEFAQYFDPQILGLTGTQEEVDAITDQFGVYVDLVDMESSVLDYTVDHASRFFIINPQGQLIDAMSHSTTPVELAARIERTLQRYPAQ